MDEERKPGSLEDQVATGHAAIGGPIAWEEPRFVTQGHLGGYIAGGDPATYFPDLWDWLMDAVHVGSVIDIGCGEGHTLDYFAQRAAEKERTLQTFGVEGIKQDDERAARLNIMQHDYSFQPLAMNRDWDLVWCCEFVEHVAARYIPHFLETMKSGKIVLMTHAEPGQAGYHHVNLQDDSYWIGALAAVGFRFDHELTQVTRGIAAANTSPWNHYVRSGLAFRRNDT